MCPNLSNNDIQTAIDQCAAEPIHIPGLVQPFGCLLAFDPATSEILYASENTKDYLGVTCDDLLGENLSARLDELVWHDIHNSLANVREFGIASSAGVHMIHGLELAARTFATDTLHVVEFETNQDARFSAPEALRTLNFLITSIQKCDDVQSMLELTASLMRHISAYDRVMIYQFDRDYNGEVAAEDIATGIDSFLGLRFPHWDIPKQARSIMHQVPLRFISDVDQEPVQLRASAQNAAPLDITLAATRGVSSVHMEYLRNMGVMATMTLSVIIDGHLWGLISFHNNTPMTPAPLLRELLTSFNEVFCKKLQTLDQKRKLEMIAHVDSFKDGLLERIADQKSFEEIAPALLTVLAADGLVIETEERTLSFGTIPQSDVTKFLLAEAEKTPDTVTTFECLASDLPNFANTLQGCAGAMVSTAGPDRGFCIFRNQMTHDVSWAGNPEKTIEAHDGKRRLAPRGSFSLYLESVEGRSRPWSEQDLYFAERLWTLIGVVERRELISSLSRQQDIMIAELNHRVRNILALVRSISQQAHESSYGSLSSYTRAIEARIQALAASHNIASGSIVSSVSFQKLVETEVAPYVSQDDNRVIVSGPAAYFKANVAPILSLIVHELITNAVKYGALSNDTGTVLVRLRAQDDGLTIHWRELDGPETVEPATRGFGSTLIEQAVPHELNGAAELQFHADGLQAHISLPGSILDAAPDSADDEHPIEPLPVPPNLQNLKPLTDMSAFILEDNFVIAHGLRGQLKELGIAHTDLLPDVSAALEHLQHNKPDFAILDVNLGKDSTSEPVALSLQERGIPFVFVSGYGQNLDLDPRLAEVPRLTKPVPTASLKHALVGLLRKDAQ